MSESVSPPQTEEEEAKKPLLWLSGKLRQPPTTIRDVCAEAGLDLKGGLEPWPAAAAMVAHFRAVSESADQEAKRHRERKSKAEADAAERENQVAEGELVAAAQLIFRDVAEKVRSIVENAPRMEEPLKDWLLKEFRAIKLDDAQLQSLR